MASISPFCIAATALGAGADADERGVVGLQARLRHSVVER